jgi:hypothetical protein
VSVIPLIKIELKNNVLVRGLLMAIRRKRKENGHLANSRIYFKQTMNPEVYNSFGGQMCRFYLTIEQEDGKQSCPSKIMIYFFFLNVTVYKVQKLNVSKLDILSTESYSILRGYKIKVCPTN